MSDRWTWIVVAALVAAVWWWRKREAAPGPAVGTAAPSMATTGVVATLLTAGRDANGCGPHSSKSCGFMLPPAKPLAAVGFGRVAPAVLMNAPAAPAPAPKKLPPGSKCPAGQTPRAFKVGAESWIECR